MKHKLKIYPEHFSAVLLGDKRAEFRRDDRKPRFERGDTLELEEYSLETGFTGLSVEVLVTHVARGGVIPEGYAMLSIEVQP